MKLAERLEKLSFVMLWQIVRRGVHFGQCPVCEKKTAYVKRGPWLRDQYHCVRCLSIPRQRALVQVLHDFIPNWKSRSIHESSPSGPTFRKFSAECLRYVPTQYFPNIQPGTVYRGFRCEDLANQTFDDESFDIVITQDVLEHLVEPVRGLTEICRTLRPGGVHVLTVPWYYWRDTRVRARAVDGAMQYLAEPEYHGSPVHDNSSLVVTEWGGDLLDTIYASSGMATTAVRIRDKRIAVDGQFREVFISRKQPEDTGGLLDRWTHT